MKRLGDQQQELGLTFQSIKKNGNKTKQNEIENT